MACPSIFLKVYSNKLFLFQLTNNLCRSFTKIVIILLFSKAVFIKKYYFNFLFFNFKFVRLYHNEQCRHVRGKLVLVTVRNIV